MDISGMNTIYNELASSAASTQKIKQNIESKDYTKASENELMDACKEFEAYFVEQMYKSMLKTVPESEVLSGSTNTMMDYYKDQMVQSIAKETSEQNNGLGLAQMLYEQMKVNYGLTETKEKES